MSIYSRIARKKPRRKSEDVDEAYVQWVRTLPCAVPVRLSEILPGYGPLAKIEAHHAGSRGLSQRAPDRTCIPLCVWHHREGPHSVHKLGRKFWEHHGLDRDELIKQLNQAYDTRASAH